MVKRMSWMKGIKNRHPELVLTRDKALAITVLSVDLSLLYLLGDPQDPAAVWKTWSEQFQRKTSAKMLKLRCLDLVHLSKGKSVKEHIKVMTEICNELAIKNGGEITDKYYVVYLLVSSHACH